MREGAALKLKGFEGLALSVLKQAVTDASSKEKYRRTSVMVDVFNKGHTLWCELLDMNPDVFEDKIFTLIDQREEDKDGGS